MDSFSLTIAPSSSMSPFRKLFHQVEAFHVILVLSCAFFCLTESGPCMTNGVQKSTEYDACGSYGGGLGISGYTAQGPVAQMNVESVCASSHSFCFPSTLHGFSQQQKLNSAVLEASNTQSDGSLEVGPGQGSRWAGNESSLSNYGMFELLNGRTVSCFLNFREGVDELSSTQKDSAEQSNVCSCEGPVLNQKTTGFMRNINSEIEYRTSDVSPSTQVKISPPTLDWGEKHLYFPSVAFLTVVNTCNDSNLQIYEPFSTNIQFYPCNFSEVLLGPGEVASICFVFLPRWLGLSSAHLILQTSLGGFLVQVKGYAAESPYEISPSVSQDVFSNGRLSKNLSLFNPFDETIYVKEVGAWILVSQGNTTHNIKATCSVENFWESNEIGLLPTKDWLVVKSGQVGSSLLATRPHKSWEIGPHSGESVMEIDFSYGSGGKIYGAFCMQFLRGSQERSDTIVVPLEVDLDNYDGTINSVSVSLDALVSSDSSNIFVAISMRNWTPYVLSVVSIGEFAATEVFQIKYIEGLLLFPGTMTKVAIITYNQLYFESHDSAHDMSYVNENCKLVVMTNDSRSPQIEIPCQDIIHVCQRHRENSYIGYDHRYGGTGGGNQRTRSMKSSKKFEAALERADEFVLANWKLQGTAMAMSVLDDHEVEFPTVEVGTHDSKWITVKNPSEQPVVMQLILHSGEIVDDCRDVDGFMQPLSSKSLGRSGFTAPIRYGFSMAEGALTEAFVHPHGKASFGPIFFHPSNRCGWRSSALIRNNLSGVEWLSLRGFGGSISLVLLERSKPIQSIEFAVDLPVSRNMSPPDFFLHVEETIFACSQPLSKELYAKNTGDLPVEVKSIEVSGRECGLDGFMVHTCKSFSLEPGESTKLLISYQVDFSAAIVNRDLELGLAGGVLVIPMKASLPLEMFNLCKKSVFWVRLKKFFAAIIAAFFMFLIFCGIFPNVIPLGFQDYQCKNGKAHNATVRNAGKSSRTHRKQKRSMPMEVDSELRSVEEEKTSKQESESVTRYTDDQHGVLQRQGVIQEVTTPLENHEKITILSEDPKDKAVPSLLSKSVVLENSDMLDTSQLCRLTVKTGKEKSKRRRKRKGGYTGLTGLFEVSSSQSGNSTPSSPLSPVTSATPSRTWSPSHDVDRVVDRNPFTLASDQHSEQVQVSDPPSRGIVTGREVSLKYCKNNCFPSVEEPSMSRRTTSKPVLLPSATFPGTGCAVPSLQNPSSLGAISPIAPHARAPGPNLYNQKTAKLEEKMGDDYTYDIWGDHFSRLHLMGSSKGATIVKTMATENDSNSFFVKGPQALMTKSQQKSVANTVGPESQTYMVES